MVRLHMDSLCSPDGWIQNTISHHRITHRELRQTTSHDSYYARVASLGLEASETVYIVVDVNVSVAKQHLLKHNITIFSL